MAGEGTSLDDGIQAVATDHRLVRPGDLFVAIRGVRLDGHQFVEGALQNGARAVLLSALPEAPPPRGVAYFQVEDTIRALGRLAAHWRSKMPAKVVGITGSVGKTSTKEITASILSSRLVTLKSEKSLNNEIGLPLAVLGLTPEVQIAVLEMGGSYAMGEIEYLCSIARPQVGVVLNVRHVHIERMGSLERIAENKSELVASLPPDGLAVLNADDSLVREMASKARCPVLWYGLDARAAIRADEIESHGLEGVRFRLHVRGRSYYVRAPVLGKHSVHGILAGVAVAHSQGMDDPEIINAVQNLPSGLRLLVSRGINCSTIIDDTYNASPSSMLAALNLLSEIPGRKIAVLGDMAELGWYAEEGHLKVGVRAADVCDQLYVVGPLGEIIARGAVEAGMSPVAVEHFDDAVQVGAVLRNEVREGDVVLIKGSRVLELDRLAAQLTVPGGDGS